MEEKLFTILVKNELYKNNVFVLGQLAGVAKVMYGMLIIQHFDIMHPTNYQTMTVRTTESNWEEFIKTIKKHFRGMCEFNIEVDKKLIELFD